MDPFALKFYCPIQNNIRPNFGDRLNFDTCEHPLNCPQKHGDLSIRYLIFTPFNLFDKRTIIARGAIFREAMSNLNVFE